MYRGKVTKLLADKLMQYEDVFGDSYSLIETDKDTEISIVEDIDYCIENDKIKVYENSDEIII